MLYDAVVVIAQSRMQDRYREAARRMLLAEAAQARGTIAIWVGHLFVWIGERIEGVRYVPVATRAPHCSSH
ncbi:MAG: hypothetical protein M3Y58_13830 [Chloroflexota bacterium]|nr:hypothetical protein [Chloroflexota bacterium]